jgi:hypothetical protein
MLLGERPYSVHIFGSLGKSIDTARQTGFFRWFHLEPTEHRRNPPGVVMRFRPSGDRFRDRCYLDVLTTDSQDIMRLELVVQRTFLDGRDALFGQDLVKSFLQASLTDACRDRLQDFLSEINVPSGDGRTPGHLVFRGRRGAWNVQTGWSRLRLANLTTSSTPSLVVNVGANPKAPNAEEVDDKWYRRLHMHWPFWASW